MAALVLAIEPDPSQATVLRQIIGTRTKADVTVVESRDTAIDALGEAVPDLILLTALLSPGDEEALIRHLRTLPQATDVQTLTIPRLREADGRTDRPVPPTLRRPVWSTATARRMPYPSRATRTGPARTTRGNGDPASRTRSPQRPTTRPRGRRQEQ